MFATNTLPQPHPVRRALLGALWYFELFQYPLTQQEVAQYSNCSAEAPEVIASSLAELIREGQVFQFGSYFQSKNEPSWVARDRKSVV